MMSHHSANFTNPKNAVNNPKREFLVVGTSWCQMNICVCVSATECHKQQEDCDAQEWQKSTSWAFPSMVRAGNWSRWRCPFGGFHRKLWYTDRQRDHEPRSKIVLHFGGLAGGTVNHFGENVQRVTQRLYFLNNVVLYKILHVEVTIRKLGKG